MVIIYLTCIGKRREGNEITEYRLKDLLNETYDIKSVDLKNMLKAGEVAVTNLTLTGDGRLMSYDLKGFKDLNPKFKKDLIPVNANRVDTRNQNAMYQGQKLDKNIPMSGYSNQKNVLNNPTPVSAPMSTPTPNRVAPSQRPINNEVQIDPKNAYDSNEGSTILCVTNNGDLGLMHKPSKQMKKFHSNVTYACYVGQGHNLHIFFTAVENGQNVLRHILYDDCEVKKNQVICECPSNVGVGKKCNPTISENGGIANKPHYYITKDRDYIFVPLKVDNGNGYQVYGFLIYDVREKSYHYGFANDFDTAKSVYSLANTLHQSNEHEISYKLDYSDYDGEGLRLFGCGLSLHRPTHSFGIY